MESIAYLLKQTGHQLSARHRHGFGIHSPRLFDYVVNVVEERHPYYAFRTLRHYRAALDSTLPRGGRLTQAGTCELLFRTIVHEQARTVVVVSSGADANLLAAYAAATGRETQVHVFVPTEKTPEFVGNVIKNGNEAQKKYHEGNIRENLSLFLSQAAPIDLAVIGAAAPQGGGEWIGFLREGMHDRSILMVEKPRVAPGADVWKPALAGGRFTAAVDHFSAALLFADPHLPGATYKV